MARENKIRVCIRLPVEDIEFLDQEVAKVGEQKTDRTEQLHLCILTRRISLMPKWKQEKLAKRLDVKPSFTQGASAADRGAMSDMMEGRPGPAEELPLDGG